jgi:DNA-binding NarL/FixJ family response regulator
MSKAEIIRVLVADDHPVVCYGLSAIISELSASVRDSMQR